MTHHLIRRLGARLARPGVLAVPAALLTTSFAVGARLDHHPAAAAHRQARPGALRVELAAPGHRGAVSLSFTGIVPGAQRALPLDVRNGGTLAFRRLVLRTRVRHSSALDRDRTSGLHISLVRCRRRWERQRGGAWRCPSGRSRTIVRWRPVVVRQVPLRGLAAMHPRRVDHLLLRVVLPASAGNAFQGQASRLWLVMAGA